MPRTANREPPPDRPDVVVFRPVIPIAGFILGAAIDRSTVPRWL